VKIGQTRLTRRHLDSGTKRDLSASGSDNLSVSWPPLSIYTLESHASAHNFYMSKKKKKKKGKKGGKLKKY
jgi:hypothetical protein